MSCRATWKYSQTWNKNSSSDKCSLWTAVETKNQINISKTYLCQRLFTNFQKKEVLISYLNLLSKTLGPPNKGRLTEERELCAERCGEGPSLFFSPFVFLLAYEDIFLHIISPSEYTFTLSIPLSLWTFFCANHIQCTTYQLEETFQVCDFSSTDMWDLWPHL